MAWLRNFFKDKINIGLLILIAVSTILILPGLGYGLPLHLIGDEESSIGAAMKMIELKILIPAQEPAAFDFFYYGPVMAYLVIIASLPAILFKLVALKFSIFAMLRSIIADLMVGSLSKRLS